MYSGMMITSCIIDTFDRQCNWCSRHIPQAEFPVRAKIFPARAAKIPCSVAQGIGAQPIELPGKFGAKIVVGGRNLRDSLLFSLFSGNRSLSSLLFVELA
jgi:hypothetical protein